jgi:hypothetical protein
MFSATNRLRRTVLSLGSAAVSSVIVCCVVILTNYDEFSRSLTSWFLFVRGAVLIILLAWLITLPLVLSFKQLAGWRFWFLLITGTLIGPALCSGLNFCIGLADSTRHVDILESWRVELVITTISLLATALYLVSLKYFIPQSAQ